MSSIERQPRTNDRGEEEHSSHCPKTNRIPQVKKDIHPELLSLVLRAVPL